MSKGSKRRPMKIPKEEYAKNWNRIFKKKNDRQDTKKDN